MESSYAKKQRLKQFARGFTDLQWDTLAADAEFKRHLSGDALDFERARERAEVLFPSLKPKPAPPVVLKSLSALPTAVALR